MKELLEQLLDKHIEYLKGVRKRVQITPFTVLEFNTSEIGINKTIIEQIGRKGFLIYVIKTKEELTQNKAEQGYNNLKNEGYGAFRVNNEKDDNHFEYWKNKSGEKCLYVGSSQDIKKRLKEHLGIQSKTTYALHLSEWWEDKNITVELYEVSNVKEMQLYEDLLWDELKPLLGKHGKR